MLEPLLEGGPVTQAAAAVVQAVVQVRLPLSAVGCSELSVCAGICHQLASWSCSYHKVCILQLLLLLLLSKVITMSR